MRHEGEGEAITLFRFGDDADAAHAGDNLVAGLQIAQAAAERSAIGDHDHGVHALILGFDPFAVVADQGAMVGGGIKIVGGAAGPVYCFEDRIAGIEGRAAQAEQLRQELLHIGSFGGFDLEAQVGRLGVGAADGKPLDFKTAVEFDHGIEDLLHQVRIDQVAFGFDDFLVH